jgi:hypothetical protein
LEKGEWRSGLRLSAIEGTDDTATTAIEYMGINHCGFDIFVTEEFLDGADVVAVLQKMGGEGVTEGVTTDALGDFGGANGLVEGFLDTAGMEGVTVGEGMAIVFFDSKGGKDKLPAPIPASVRVFFGEGMGEGDLAMTARSILFVEALDDAEMFLGRSGCGA